MNEETALKWYKQAGHDLEIAGRNVEIEGYDVAAFLSQQAVEKLLKAIFAYGGRRIPHSHHIDDLARDLHVAPEVLDDVLELTADYTFARYPDVADHVPYEAYDEDIAREKVARARNIFERLQERLQGLEEYDTGEEDFDEEQGNSDEQEFYEEPNE